MSNATCEEDSDTIEGVAYNCQDHGECNSTIRRSECCPLPCSKVQDGARNEHHMLNGVCVASNKGNTPVISAIFLMEFRARVH